MCCFWALYVLHLNVICIIFGYRVCVLIISSLHAHARKACKGTKNFSHTQAKTTKFLFLIFSSTATHPLPLLSPPVLFLSLSSLTLPIIHSKIAVCFDIFPTHTRYIPDTYPIHTYIPWILHEYPTNIPWIPHKAEKRERKRRKSASFQPASRIFPCIFQKKIVPLHV